MAVAAAIAQKKQGAPRAASMTQGEQGDDERDHQVVEHFIAQRPSYGDHRLHRENPRKQKEVLDKVEGCVKTALRNLALRWKYEG